MHKSRLDHVANGDESAWQLRRAHAQENCSEGTRVGENPLYRRRWRLVDLPMILSVRKT